MKFYYVTFRSVTHGQRAEALLRQADVRCHLLRTPRWMEEQGCGYALKIWTKEIAPAVMRLQEKGVPLRRVYAQRRDGQLEELAL